MTWKITYTRPTQAYENGNKIPAKLVDTLPEGLELTGNITANVTDGTGAVTADSTTESGEIIFDVSGLSQGGTVEITYETKLTAQALEEIWSGKQEKKSFTNQVQAYDTENTPMSDLKRTATASVDKDWGGFTMLSKEGKVTTPTATNDLWSIDWTIVVNTAGQSFQTLTVFDQMGKGLHLQGNVMVNNQAKTVASGEDSEGTIATMKIPLVENGTPNAAADTYTITYTTTIDKNYFEQITGGDSLTDVNLENKAWLEYTWPEGVGTGGIHTPPTITKGPKDLGISSALIKKTATGYNPVDHSITWEITLNPNEVDMQSASIVDNLTGLGQTFLPYGGTKTEEEKRTAVEAEISEAFTKALPTGAGLDSCTLSDGGKLAVQLTGIGKNSLTVELKTYVTDPAVWAGNVTKEYKNTVVLLKEGTTVGNTEITENRTATAIQKVTSNVLRKAHKGFDPKTKALTWQLIVNENATALGDVIITDVLPEGLTYVPGSATLDPLGFSGEDNTFVVDGQKITINLKNLSAQRVITFQTAVKVNTDAFRKGEDVSFVNKASLDRAVNEKDVTSNESTATIQNAILAKGVEQEGTSNKVTYTVQINPLGMDIKEGTVLKVKDTFLENGMFLDEESVTLYHGKGSAPPKEGKYQVGLTADGEVTPKADVAYDTKANSFEVTIPVATNSYVLTYDVYIVRQNVELSNTVELVGVVPSVSGENRSANCGFTLEAFGGASLRPPTDKFFSLSIKAVDKDDTNKKLAVTFGIYSEKKESALLAEVTGDAGSGVVTLALPIALVKDVETLYFRERKVPTSYLLDNSWQEVTVKGHNPEKEIVVEKAKAPTKPNAKLEITKVDASNQEKKLEGAVFTLYSDFDCTVEIETKTTDGNGVCTFEGLMPTTEYYLKETNPPDGYLADAESVAVIMGKNEDTVPITVENQRKSTTPSIPSTPGGGGGSTAKPEEDKPIPPVEEEVPAETPLLPEEGEEVPETPILPDGEEATTAGSFGTEGKAQEERFLIGDGEVPYGDKYLYDENGNRIYPDGVPKTEDRNTWFLWTGLMAISLLSALALLRTARKRENSRR